MSTAISKVVAGGKTQQEIDTMKSKHGLLTLVTIKGEKDRHWWFKKPDMKTLSASAAIAEHDPIGSTIIYFDNCLVDGDAEAKHNVDDWVAISSNLQGLIKDQETEVKNF